MKKLITSVVLVIGISAAVLIGWADDPAKSCPSASGTAGTAAKACGQDGGSCPASGMTATSACQGCPKATAACGSGSACSQATACQDGGSCPAAAACAKSTSGGECSETACGGSACSGTCSSTACADCPITVAMKALPQMTYMVGEEKTCCPDAAKDLAAKSNLPIQYVVAEKCYTCPNEATVALTEATEQFVASFVEPRTCSESGKVTVCSREFCCSQMASTSASVAKAAMDKVQLTYLVGEKECHCPTEAANLAKESGDPKVFVVAGAEPTCCEVTARLNLARAKYKAAVVALMESEPKDSEKLTSKDS